MKLAIFLASITLTATVTATAATKSTIAEVLRSEERVCDRINDDNLKLECYQLLDRNQFDRTSLNFCDQLDDAAPTVYCLVNLANRSLESSAADVCARIRDDYEAIRCVQNARDSFYVPAALSFCDGMESASGTTTCMGIFSNKRVQSSAAKACARINNEASKLECGRAIVGRFFSESHVQLCDSMETATATVRCFQQF